MSANTKPPAALRPLDHIELYSSSRHALGIYRAVTTTCRYHRLGPSLTRALRSHDQGTISSSSGSSLHQLYDALAVVVRKHPMLHVGILDEAASRGATYAHLESVDLRERVGVESVEGCSGAVYEEDLAKKIGARHDLLFEEVDTRPPWKVTVVVPRGDWVEQDSEDGFVDIIFSFHHALMDGTGGKLFHQHLLAALNSPPTPSSSSSLSSSPILSFPTPPSLPSPQSSIVPFSFTTLFFARVLWHEFAPAFLKSAPASPVWPRDRVDFARPYATRVRPVYYTAAESCALVAACRAHGTSLTGLFNALTLASLARHTAGSEQAERFSAGTPISLAPYAKEQDGGSPEALRVLLTSLTHDFEASDLAPFRRYTASSSPSDDSAAAAADKHLWHLAARNKSDLSTRCATLPFDDITGMLSYVTDWPTWWRKKDGQPRDQSFSVSNIGILRQQPPNAAAAASPSSSSDSDSTANPAATRISRVTFSNASMVTGAAVGVNIASADGHDGCLCAALSWQDGVPDARLMEALEEDFRCIPRRMLETGRFFA